MIIATGNANFTCIKHNVALPNNGLKAPTRPATAGQPQGIIQFAPKAPAYCASGYHRVGARCVKLPVVAKCKAGYVLAHGKCIKKPTVSILCKPGYVLSMASASGSRCSQRAAGPAISARPRANASSRLS